MSEKLTATVKWFDNAKGYGFLDGPDGDVFVHFRSIVGGDGYKTLRDGQTVEYVQVRGQKGLQAEEVVAIG